MTDCKQPISLSQALSGFAAGLRFEQLPPEVVEKARLLVLDTLGCAFAAADTDSAAATARAVLARAGQGAASVVGHARRFMPADAALYNGTLAHVLDYDDTHSGSVVHASSALVPAVLAVAEEEGRGGRDALAALVVGVESAIRIGLPARHGFHLKGFHTTAVCAPFGAALSTGMLRNASVQTMAEALGIVGSFGFGLMECIPAGAGCKQLHSGLGASAGIRSADLAEAGFTGPASVFEGRLGLYNALLGQHALDLTAVPRNLGSDWELMDLCPKLYPCCGHLLSFLDAAKQLRDEGVRPELIASIEVRTSRAASNVVCEPWSSKLQPTTGYEAKFSLPFAMALMLARGHAGLDDFSDEACRDPSITALMPLVRHVVEPDFIAADMTAWVGILLKDGSFRNCHIPFARGDRRDPLKAEELIAKFSANAVRLGAARAQHVIDLVMGLDKAASLDPLMAEVRGLPAA